MPGLTLGITETNPKKGAIQYDARRVDGLPLKIVAAASLSTVPVGTIVTWQEETTSGKQILCTGAAPYTDDEYSTYAIIGIGFLEAVTQQNGTLNQATAVFSDGDIAAMVSDLAPVAQVPFKASEQPVAGAGCYVTKGGQISNSAGGNVAFPGEVFVGTPGVQNSGQLKTGFMFARLSKNTI